MLVRNSGMRKVLRLRDGDSERGSGIQEGTGTRLGGAQMRRATAGALPGRGDDCRGHNLAVEVRASIEKGNRA